MTARARKAVPLRGAADQALVDAAAGPAARWLRTLADCGKTPDQARQLLHAAVDQAANYLAGTNGGALPTPGGDHG